MASKKSPLAGHKPDSPKLWTPDQKLSDRAKNIAWMLFLECWRAQLAADQENTDFDGERAYRDCIEVATKIVKIEEEASGQRN